GGDQVVASHTELAAQPANASGQSDTGDAGLGEDAKGHTEVEGHALAIDVHDLGAALGAGGHRRRVNAYGAHLGKVYDEAAVVAGTARNVMAAATDRNRKAMRAAVVHGVDDVGDARAANDGGR